MRIRDEAAYTLRKQAVMEACYNCYAEHGLHGTGISALADAAGLSKAGLYVHFENLDDLIIQSTEYCMAKVEDDFMAKAPTNASELAAFIDEIPYWTAREHGKKYRLMFQVYTHPKYREYGKKFYAGVDKRYTEYAKQMEADLGIPYEKLTPLIFILIRASVHYAIFEDEFYLKSQISVLKEAVVMFAEKYSCTISRQ